MEICLLSRNKGLTGNGKKNLKPSKTYQSENFKNSLSYAIVVCNKSITFLSDISKFRSIFLVNGNRCVCPYILFLSILNTCMYSDSDNYVYQHSINNTVTRPMNHQFKLNSSNLSSILSGKTNIICFIKIRPLYRLFVKNRPIYLVLSTLDKYIIFFITTRPSVLSRIDQNVIRFIKTRPMYHVLSKLA